jgi:hypothetical protein
MARNNVYITANNRGPLVNITTWITLVAMCLATGVKVISKRVMVRKFQRDDYYILAAMVRPLPPIKAMVC